VAFAAPAFAECAFVVGLAILSYRVGQGCQATSAGGSIRVSSGNVRTRKQHARSPAPLPAILWPNLLLGPAERGADCSPPVRAGALPWMATTQSA
jgi:hypothetical protein